MAYSNLKAEMARKDITIESMAQMLGIHRNSVANKSLSDCTPSSAPMSFTLL